MNILTYLLLDPVATCVVAGILGLIVGSFLNVVIYRLPKMMEHDWQVQCAELLGQLKDPASPPCAVGRVAAFNLVYPRSHCPHCGHQITALENIPILSFLWQRGRCTACHQAISLRYPVIEISSAILATITAWHFGFGWPLLGALLLTWALLTASVIDYDHQLLSDEITLPFLWLGILCNFFNLYTDLHSSVIGAMGGYLSLWSVYWGFKIVTGKEGMGYGDFKLLAMLGAWMGWQGLFLTIFMSSLVGAVVGLSLIIISGRDKNRPIPFGPYLAAAGWLNLLWGDSLTQTYLGWSTLP
jgi:leader peptidase (prepilin peptidase)/N-methyltransferase